MSFQFRVGKKSLKWTDKRAKIILEVLGRHLQLGLTTLHSQMTIQARCAWSSISATSSRS